MRASRHRGQTLVEFALVAPVLLLMIFGIITLGIGVFYQQQLTNAARETARYAAIHSATAQCPTTSWRQPNWSRVGPEIDQTTYYACDPPNLHWPKMTRTGGVTCGGSTAARELSACWSGYWDADPSANPTLMTRPRPRLTAQPTSSTNAQSREPIPNSRRIPSVARRRRRHPATTWRAISRHRATSAARTG